MSRLLCCTARSCIDPGDERGRGLHDRSPKEGADGAGAWLVPCGLVVSAIPYNRGDPGSNPSSDKKKKFKKNKKNLKKKFHTKYRKKQEILL